MGSQQHSQQDQALLSAYIDGALAPAQARQLEQRMSTCSELRQHYEELLQMRDALRSMPDVRPPRSLRIDVARLEAARGWRWWLIAPPGGRLVPSLGLMASLIVCVFALQFIMIAPNSPVSPPLKGSVSLSDNQDTAAKSAQAPELSMAAESVPLVADDAMTVDLTAFVQYLVVIVSLVLVIACVRWLWVVRHYQQRPQRR